MVIENQYSFIIKLIYNLIIIVDELNNQLIYNGFSFSLYNKNGITNIINKNL